MTYDAEVQRAVAHWGPAYGLTLDPMLIHAVIEKETRHGALPLKNREPNGNFSYGPMQVEDITATSVLHVDPASLLDPATGIYYGTQYLASLIQRFKGDATRAISAYNAGPGKAKVNPSTGQYPNQQYVIDVLGFWNSFKRAAVAAAPAVLPLLVLGGLALYYLSQRRRRAA